MTAAYRCPFCGDLANTQEHFEERRWPRYGAGGPDATMQVCAAFETSLKKAKRSRETDPDAWGVGLATSSVRGQVGALWLRRLELLEQTHPTLLLADLGHDTASELARAVARTLLSAKKEPDFAAVLPARLLVALDEVTVDYARTPYDELEAWKRPLRNAVGDAVFRLRPEITAWQFGCDVIDVLADAPDASASLDLIADALDWEGLLVAVAAAVHELIDADEHVREWESKTIQRVLALPQWAATSSTLTADSRRQFVVALDGARLAHERMLGADVPRNRHDQAVCVAIDLAVKVVSRKIPQLRKKLHQYGIATLAAATSRGDKTVSPAVAARG